MLKDRPTKTCWIKLLTNSPQECEAAFGMSTALRRVTHSKKVMFLVKCTLTGMGFMIFTSIYSN